MPSWSHPSRHRTESDTAGASDSEATAVVSAGSNGPTNPAGCGEGGERMKRSLRRLLTASAICLGAGIVLAGTPLPHPPFTTGGFVPPDSLVFRQEVAVGKLLSKYALGKARCDWSALIALQLAYEPANMGKVPAVQQKWTDCQANNLTRYNVGRGKLLLKGTPACLDQAGIDGIRDQIDAQFPGLGAIVYCDGDAKAPDPVTGFNIPDKKQEAEGEVAAAKVAAKAGVLAGKCYSLALKYAFKFAGAIPPEFLTKIDGCFTKASATADGAMDKLNQTQKLPDCLPVDDAKTLAATVIGVAGQFNDENYCASPSGAFVESPEAS